jgi:hypothetical protein
MPNVASQRSDWARVAARIAGPVLSNLAARTLKRNMPVEAHPDAKDREKVTHLEAFGRLLSGIAPWLALGVAETRAFAEQAREGIDAMTDPASPDYATWGGHAQPLVDAAFLCQGILRAPGVLWEPLPGRVKQNLLAALRSTRSIRPAACNWLLFSATVEAALFRMGASDWDGMRIDYAVRQHEQWYVGDGHYGDGPQFHADYYNAFVIHPMLLEIVRALGDAGGFGVGRTEKILQRAVRYAVVQERLISPEGTFPPIGRSLAYRFGALQSLAQASLLQLLPPTIKPAQVREGIGAVIRRTMAAEGTFDRDGWLRIGFCGAQPGVGEAYISTGSLYLTAAGLLPLGLPQSNPFWSDPPAPWTSQAAWGGAAFPIDKAI